MGQNYPFSYITDKLLLKINNQYRGPGKLQNTWFSSQYQACLLFLASNANDLKLLKHKEKKNCDKS